MKVEYLYCVDEREINHLNVNQLVMTTITTLDLAKRLNQSFDRVQSLARINTNEVKGATDCRVSSNLEYNELTLVCGCYSNDSENYIRFVHVPQTNDTFTF